MKINEERLERIMSMVIEDHSTALILDSGLNLAALLPRVLDRLDEIKDRQLINSLEFDQLTRKVNDLYINQEV